MHFTVLWHLTFTPFNETTPILVIVNYVSLLVCMHSLFRAWTKSNSRGVNCNSASEIILNGMYHAH